MVLHQILKYYKGFEGYILRYCLPNTGKLQTSRNMSILLCQRENSSLDEKTNPNRKAQLGVIVSQIGPFITPDITYYYIVSTKSLRLHARTMTHTTHMSHL